MEALLNPDLWIGLAVLTLLEIVLGIDNLIFISILSGKLPPEQRSKARRLGLSLALITARSCFFATSPTATRSSRPIVAPVGFDGYPRRIAFVRGVIAASRSAGSRRKSFWA